MCALEIHEQNKSRSLLQVDKGLVDERGYTSEKVCENVFKEA